jgi:Kef-type K+ transport system membrane component KefB
LSNVATPGTTSALRRPFFGPLVYLLMIAGTVAVYFAIRAVGETIAAPAASLAERSTAASESASKVDVVLHVLVTLAAIITLGHVFGRGLRWLGQPPVIGEVLAGLVLGPSVLGTLWPQMAHLLVPSVEQDPGGTVVSALTAISRLGVVLYMFLLGLELDLAHLRKKVHSTVAISHASIVVPFLLGTGLALWIYPVVSSSEVSFTAFSLFMGTAMAITAFPVLARILTDLKLEKTSLGVIALSCAATDDITAWCLLAFVIGMAQAQLSDAAQVLMLAVCYVAVMFLLVRPLLHRFLRRYEDAEEFPAWIVPGVLVAVLLSAAATKTIGIHSLFGGFTMGVVLSSSDRLTAMLRDKFHDIATILLLPAFFAITGLRTQISLLENGYEWFLTGMIILVATVGKVGGTLAAARFTGLSWRNSTALGMLMNTRGLMELIALNIGLEIGVISPTLFAMMVLMALATTVATSPVVRMLLRPADVPAAV